jgi:hypothetical protein
MVWMVTNVSDEQHLPTNRALRNATQQLYAVSSWQSRWHRLGSARMPFNSPVMTLLRHDRAVRQRPGKQLS